MKSIMKIATIILSLLGIAFLGGSLLAYLQGFALQISLLAGTGIICLIGAVVMTVLGKKASDN